MKILFCWNMRMLRNNPLHSIFTILNLVFSYMLLTCMKLVTQHRIYLDNTDGDGLLWYVAVFLSIVVFLATLLTTYHAFLTSIRERERRYERLSAAGTTKRQIFGSLLLEALVINCIGALVGIVLGFALFIAFKLHAPETHGFSWLLKQGMEQIPLKLRPVNDQSFDGFSYMPTPQRSVYCLLPEFFSVPAAMAMAVGRIRSLRKRGKQRPRRVFRADQLSFSRLLGRFYGEGGMVNRLMDKRERPRRRFILSVFAIGIASMAITTNVSVLWMHAYTDDKHLYLRTSGDNIQFEKRVDDYLDGDDFRSVAEEVRIYRCYLPRVYCTIGDDLIAQSTKKMLQNKRVRYRPFLYPVSDSDTNIIMPQMIFLQDGRFEVLRSKYVGKGEINAVLLPGNSVRGDDFAWMKSDLGIQEWELCFYSDPQARYVILDERTKKEYETLEARKARGDAEPSDKVQPDYSCTDVTEYLQKVRGKTTEKIKVNVWQMPPEALALSSEKETPTPATTQEWDINRALPTLVFPMSAQSSFEAHLSDTNEGVRMSANARDGISSAESDTASETDDISSLAHNLRDALQRGTEGYVAEHPFGSGTRYMRGENYSPEKEPVLGFPLFHIVNYDTPSLIYADMRLRFDNLDYPELIWILGITVALMLFSLLTNIIHAVNGHHTLRRHDHAVLQSCGMSEDQMRKAIRYEAVWYSVHSLLCGFAGYLVLFSVCLIALAKGASYERIPRETAQLAVWSTDCSVNLLHAWGNLLNNVERIWWWVFPTAAVLVFVMFRLANDVVLRRTRQDALVPQLKKDI